MDASKYKLFLEDLFELVKPRSQVPVDLNYGSLQIWARGNEEYWFEKPPIPLANQICVDTKNLIFKKYNYAINTLDNPTITNQIGKIDKLIDKSKCDPEELNKYLDQGHRIIAYDGGSVEIIYFKEKGDEFYIDIRSRPRTPIASTQEFQEILLKVHQEDQKLVRKSTIKTFISLNKYFVSDLSQSIIEYL